MSDPFKQYEVEEDPFAQYVSQESPSRDDVIKDFGDISNDVARGIDPIDAKRGRVSSYIASDGSVDVGTALDNAEYFGAKLIGKDGAKIDESFQEIVIQTQIGDTPEWVLETLFKETEWIWGEGGVILDTTISQENRARLLEMESGVPRLRVMEATARAYLPEWSYNTLGIPQRTQPQGAMEWTEEVVGSVVGNVAAFFTGAKLLKAVGGVRAVPGVAEGLGRLAEVSPRLARMTERAASTFVVLGVKSQFHSDSTDLKERAKMLNTDAIISAAFPLADWASEIPKVGIPAAATVMFAAGTQGGETLEEKLVGGTSLLLMWGLSYGATYKEATKLATETAKAAGVKDPAAFVKSFSRANILKGAQNIKDQIFMQGLTKATAAGAKAKMDAGQKLLPSDRLAVAKANENAVVRMAKTGEVAPIKADRAVLQSRAITKAVTDGTFQEVEEKALVAGRGGRGEQVGVQREADAGVKILNKPKTISLEMLSDEQFKNEAIFRGVWGENKESPDTYWTDSFDLAKGHAAEQKDGVVRVGLKSEMHPDLLWIEDERVSPTELFDRSGTGIREMSIAASAVREIGINVIAEIDASEVGSASDVLKKIINATTDLQAPAEFEVPTLPPEQVKEKYELQVLRDAQRFEETEPEISKKLATVPSDEESAELNDIENLSNLPPETPPDDLATPAGREFLDRAAHKMTRITESVAGYFRRFGRQYVSDPELAAKFEDSYHQIAAAPHLGVLDVHKKLTEFPRTSKADRLIIATALEADNIDEVPMRLRPVYAQIQELFATAEQMQLDAGVLQQTFEESHAARIADMDRQISQAKGKKKQELVEERGRLKEIKKYLPHNIVARRVLEEKLSDMSVGAKRSAFKKLSQFHKQRKGTHSVKGYVEAGIISETDADVVKMLMATYADTYHKIAVRGLIEWGKLNGQILPIEEEVDNPAEWNEEGELHPVARVGGLDGMKMSRLFAQGLEEMSGKGSTPYNAFDKVLGMAKVGQFVRPDIIWKHNLSQSFLGGTATLNPVKLVKRIMRAKTILLSKDELWREFESGGLYQKTDIPTRRAVDDIVQIYANKTKLYKDSETLSRVANVAGQLFGTSPEEALELLKNPEFGKLLNDAIMSVPSVVSQVTWAGDELQRTVSAIALMDKGYSAQEAAQEAARIHGAYSNVGIGYKGHMRRLAFVYSFRLLMPWEYQIKPWITLAKAGFDKSKGKKADSRKVRAAAWKLMATTMIPFLFDAMMKRNGWEIDEKERDSAFREFADKLTIKVPIGDGKTTDITPNWAPHWRYKKTIQTPEGEKDMVWVIGTPNMTISRLGIRATEDLPAELGNQASKGIFNALWAEAHPMYKTTVNYFNNDPLTYGAEPPRGVRGNEYVGGLGLVFLNTFKIYGAMAELEKIGELPEGEADKALKANLSILEKGMSWFGFQYVRNTEDRRRIGEIFTAKENLGAMARTIQNAKTLTEDEKKTRIDTIVEMGKETIGRIID